MAEKIHKHLAWLKLLESSDQLDERFPALAGYIIESRKYFQHERSIHLQVTIAIGFLLMLLLYINSIQLNLWMAVLLALSALLEAAYIVHYYKLENGIQQIWEVEKRIWEKACPTDGLNRHQPSLTPNEQAGSKHEAGN